VDREKRFLLLFGLSRLDLAIISLPADGRPDGPQRR
jgi:hypothetical protein